MTDQERSKLAGLIIGAAIKVHRALGPGLLESAYQACLVYELRRLGLRVQTEVAVPVRYGEILLDCGYRLDLLVEGAIIVEIKSVDRLIPLHSAQVLTYLRLTDALQVLLMNFNAVTLKAGLKSFLRGGMRVPVDVEEGQALPNESDGAI
jgi:GxxExxY protein